MNLEEMQEEIKMLDRILAIRDRRVYFIRCGPYIKIGTSKALEVRVKQIQRGFGCHLVPQGLDTSRSELVADEQGTFDREREIHAKFAHLRHTGEWFTEAPELTDYIEALKEAA